MRGILLYLQPNAIVYKPSSPQSHERGEQIAILAPDLNDADPKATLDSPYSVIYAPWISVESMSAGEAILIPRIGHVAGAYARRDAGHGVSAGLTELSIEGLFSNGALNNGLAQFFDRARSERLRRRGVNALVPGEKPGTAISDTAVTMAVSSRLQPAHLARQLGFLRRSLTLGTQWMVFERSTSETRQQLVERISEFLQTLWREGMLSGRESSEAFFVRCDETTMTESDRANDRTICLIGLSFADPPIGFFMNLTFNGLTAKSEVGIA